MKWKIKNIEINNQIVIAPMAGISDSAFRLISKEMGAGLIYTEMVSDKAITYKNKKTIDMLHMEKEERPISQQIFGSDVKSFVEAAKFIETTMKPDIIDINMGCPVPKVALRAQAGASLLKDPKKIGEIVSSIVQAVSIPVTVKIRTGWDDNNINAVEVAKIIESSGASAIAIHGRTRSQGYKGNIDYQTIQEVVASVKIPVIGNGDVKTLEDAKKMLALTNCKAVMIGRATIGNPWLIKELVNGLEEKETLQEITPEEIKQTIIRHINYAKKSKTDKQVVLEMRAHIPKYLKRVKNSKELTQQVFKTNTVEQLIKIINTINI